MSRTPSSTKRPRQSRSQTSLEYLFLVAGALIFIILLWLLIQGSVLQPVQTDINNTSSALASLKAGLSPSPPPG